MHAVSNLYTCDVTNWDHETFHPVGVSAAADHQREGIQMLGFTMCLNGLMSYLSSVWCEHDEERSARVELDQLLMHCHVRMTA